MPLRAMRGCSIDGFAKCPCKQAFLHGGIIGHGIISVCSCTFTYRVREFDAARQTPMLTRRQKHGIKLVCSCTFTYRVREFDAARQTPMQNPRLTHGIKLVCSCTFTYRVREFREHGIPSDPTCTFTYHVPENGASLRFSPRFPHLIKLCGMCRTRSARSGFSKIVRTEKNT